MDTIHIGLLAAMPEELGKIIENIEVNRNFEFGDLNLFSGIWKGSTPEKKILITAAWSGWGKVSAARATTRLLSSTIENKKIDFVIFNGVAGSATNYIKQWDVIISESSIQHDMDARPLFDQYVIPAINRKKIESNRYYSNLFLRALKKSKDNGNLKKFGKIYKGLIATGDQFISDKKIITNISSQFPDVLAVEMEGSAFAQVAYQEKVDWIILRTISDSADISAEQDFSTFLKEYEIHSWELIESLLRCF